MSRPAKGGALAALAAVTFLAMTGFGVFLPIFPFLALDVGAAPVEVTLAMGAYSLGQLLAAPAWGRLSDRIGRKPVIIAGLVAGACAYLVLAGAHSIMTIMAARLAAGLMAGNVGAAFAAAADIADENTRARNMGILGASAGAGFIVGPALGAFVIHGAEHAAGFDRICFTSAAMLVCAAIATGVLFSETRQATTGPLPRRARTFVLLASRPAIARLGAIMLMLIVAQAMMETTFGLWSNARLGWGAPELGWTLAGLSLVAALMQGGVAGRAARAIGEAWTLRIGLALSALGLGLLAAAGGALGVGAASLVLGVGLGLATPALQSLFAAEADGANRGAVMGLSQSASALGRVIGPAVSGLLFQFVRNDAAFIVGAVLLVAAMLASPAPRAQAPPST